MHVSHLIFHTRNEVTCPEIKPRTSETKTVTVRNRDRIGNRHQLPLQRQNRSRYPLVIQYSYGKMTIDSGCSHYKW